MLIFLHRRVIAAFALPAILIRSVEEIQEIERQNEQTTDTLQSELTPAGLSCPVAPDLGDGLGIRKSNAVGGQAVIEGVMMRSKQNVATAVRAPDGRIVCKIQTLNTLSTRVFKRPIARGAGMLYETLKLGISTLDWSARIASIGQEETPPKWWEKIFEYVSLPLGLIIGISLFLWLPYSVAKWTVGAEGNQFLYHLTSNSIQMSLMVVYMWLISFSKDVRRVFEYHGAEHKGIMCYEAGDAVTPELMKKHTRFHPRCGTSFLLVLGLVTMIFFSIVDGLLLFAGWVYPNAIVRVMMHLPLVPVVGGIGYEVLKWSDRKKNVKAVTAFIQPGLWLQRITTKEPDLNQLEVSAVSLRTAVIGTLEESENVVSEPNFSIKSA